MNNSEGDVGMIKRSYTIIIDDLNQELIEQSKVNMLKWMKDFILDPDLITVDDLYLNEIDRMRKCFRGMWE